MSLLLLLGNGGYNNTHLAELLRGEAALKGPDSCLLTSQDHYYQHSEQKASAGEERVAWGPGKRAGSADRRDEVWKGRKRRVKPTEALLPLVAGSQRKVLEGSGGRTGPAGGRLGPGPHVCWGDCGSISGSELPSHVCPESSFLPGWEIALAWNFSA